MIETDVAVVGAGIAGLACASELVERGIEVVVLETRERPGGPVDSLRKGGYLIERGPSTVRATPELELLARRSGVELVAGRSLAPALVCDGEVIRVPPPAGTLLRGRPLPLGALLAALGDPFRASSPGPKTVHRFVSERFGAAAADRLADVLTLGVYGAPATEVGFEAAFPDLAAEVGSGSLTGLAIRRLLRRRSGASEPPPPDSAGGSPTSGLVSTPHGLRSLVAALADGLGSRLRLHTPVTRIEPGPGGSLELDLPSDKLRCRHLVVTAGPHQLGRMLDSPAVRRLTRAYRPTPQTLASFGLEDPDCAARWQTFGFLIPARERLPLIGCLLPSAVFPDRAPAGAVLLTVFTAPALREAPDSEIASTLVPLLQRLLGSRTAPTPLDVARHPDGIWLYDRRHTDRTRVLRRRLAEELTPRVHLSGAAYTGVAFGAAAAAGLETAETIASDT